MPEEQIEKKKELEEEKMDAEEEGNEEDNEDDEDENGDEDDEEVVAVEPLALTRSRRANAGNLMSKMIQDEEDEFYSKTYGGFQEEDDDGDFDDSDENSYDSFESDFSEDETDEIAPEYQMVEDEPRKRSRVYKDPRPRGHANNAQAPDSTGQTATSTPVQSKQEPRAGSSSTTIRSPGKIRGDRSFRDSTKRKTEETIKNIQSERKKKKKHRNMETWVAPTQEEMLEEAKITEEENIKSLEIYQKLESEKLRKIKQIKKTLPPPYVTYLSTKMPIIVDGKDTNEKYSRNFITYVT